jgi:prostaglandin-H2 D-isomerase / glutathione transferase
MIAALKATRILVGFTLLFLTNISSAMSPSIKLTYFDIEAAAEPVRLALVLSKTPFEDTRVNFGDWPALKPTTPAGQLPIMTIDDGPARTQSKAMLRWVGSTCSETLYPREKLFDVEEAIGYVEDLQRAFAPAQAMGSSATKYGHPEDFGKTEEGKKLVQSMRESFVNEELPKYLTRMSAMITAHGGKFLVAGENPTIADCVAVPLLRGFTRGFIDYVSPNCLDGYPVIVEYIKAFCALDEVKGRYNSGIC